MAYNVKMNKDGRITVRDHLTNEVLFQHTPFFESPRERTYEFWKDAADKAARNPRTARLAHPLLLVGEAVTAPNKNVLEGEGWQDVTPFCPNFVQRNAEECSLPQPCLTLCDECRK